MGIEKLEAYVVVFFDKPDAEEIFAVCLTLAEAKDLVYDLNGLQQREPLDQRFHVVGPKPIYGSVWVGARPEGGQA